MFKTLLILYALGFWVTECMALHAKSQSVIPALASVHVDYIACASAGAGMDDGCLGEAHNWFRDRLDI
jgi:hypothetical protein